MGVLLSTYGSRGNVEPMVGLAVRSRALGAEVRGCAPPDFAELLARIAVPLVPVGRQLRPPVTGAGFIAAQVETDAATAEGCAALVLRGVMTEGVWR